MSEKKINVLLDHEPVTILEMREGAALPLREPVKIDIAGNIDAVARFIENRTSEFEHKQAHILIDRDKMAITIIFDETSYFSGKVKGSAIISKNFKEWEINYPTKSE